MKRYFNFIIKVSILNFFALILGLILFNQQPTTNSPNILVHNPTPASITKSRITLSPTPITDLRIEVSKHNTKKDCWLIINKHIYNVTSYLDSHPGGDSIILNYCGQDATTAFNTKGSSGSPHSSAAIDQLAQFQIY